MGTKIVEPGVSRPADDKEKSYYTASHLSLIWRRFKRHRLAVVGGIVMLGFMFIILFAEFFAYRQPNDSSSQVALIPPQAIHFFDEGRWSPHVYGLERLRDPATFQLVYAADPDTKIPVRIFGEGYSYKLFGFIPATRHLFVAQSDTPAIFLLGTDVQGRDIWSRIMYATRISLTIGLCGVALSLVLGILLGGVSGLFGGRVDLAIQRLIEVAQSIPTIPLWMGLAAALPNSWSVLQIYFAITIIISLVSWTELARVVRGKVLTLRDEDFVTSARLDGCSNGTIIRRHMVPSMLSHIVAATSLALPVMILSETALSFLGLGLRPPAVSWGVLLQQAQNVQSVALTPWVLIPAIPVIVAVLALNFLGDGIRDAADPYS